MTWLLTWLNGSVATLNATLQLLVLYRLDKRAISIALNFHSGELQQSCQDIITLN